MFKWLRSLICRHRFDYDDLIGRNIFTQNVKWSCWKCGKVFEEHCGLQILNYGEVQEKPKFKKWKKFKKDMESKNGND